MTEEFEKEEIERRKEERDKAYREAMKHRKRRDELNEEARKWVKKRDELNNRSRALVKEAAEHREKRDELNEKVKETKKLRDEWNAKWRELDNQIWKLKKSQGPKGGKSIGKLKKQLRDLEFKQQTSALTKEKEEELIEIMRKISREIEELEKSLEDSDEIKRLIEEAREVKAEAEKYHELVNKYADEAQVEHETMLALFMEADSLRQEADEAQERMVQAKLAADEEHKMFVSAMERVRELDKIITGMKHKKREGHGKRDDESIERAREIYERFKNGEKLSTEDLMLLQKSGFL